MLHYRYQRIALVAFLSLMCVYLLIPLVVSYGATQWLSQQGYRNVIVQLGYPGWQELSIPVVSFQLDLGDEVLMVSVTDVQMEYRLPDLLQGRVSRVVLPYLAIQMLHDQGQLSTGANAPGDVSGSPWNVLTAGDLLRRIPVLPFEEVQLNQVTVFREQATGPLRRVAIQGVIEQRNGELGGRLSFQGRETASYTLSLTGHSATTWAATLVSQRTQAAPILTWQSTAQARDGQVQVEGKLEINVREFAPFIALAVPIGPELSQVSGAVAVAWTGTAPSGASLSALRESPESLFQGSFQVTVTLPELKGVAKQIALSSSGNFSGSPARLGWTIDPGLLGTATVNMQPRIVPDAVKSLLPRGDQPLRIEPRQPLQGMLYWAESPIRLTMDGPVHVSYGAAAGPLAIDVDVVLADVVGQELVSAEGEFHLRGLVPPSLTVGISVRDVRGDLWGRVALKQRVVTGTVQVPSMMTVKQFQQGPVAIASAAIDVAAPIPVRCALASGQCTAGPGTLRIGAQGIRSAGYDVTLAEGTLALQSAESAGNSWTAQGGIDLAGVRVEPLPVAFPPSAWQMKFTANQAGIKADVRGDFPGREGVVTAKVAQSFGESEGSARLVLGPLQFDAEANRLQKWLPGLPAAFDLTAGRITASTDVAWASSRSKDSMKDSEPVMLHPGAITVQADRLSAVVQGVTIEGIDTTLNFDLLGGEQLRSRQPAVVQVASIQAGVALNDVSATADLRWTLSDPWPVLGIKDIQASLFGGSVTSPGLQVDPAKPPHRLVLSLRRFDLAKLLSLEQQKGLQGTGLLSGTIPVTVTARGGVSVKDGMVEAEAPGGVIRYQPSPDSGAFLADADSSVKLAAQALSNFQYTALRVGVQYAEDGVLQLAAQLEGRNPDMKKSPPIHFNLNVQENIPALLQSLRLVQDIEGTLEHRVRGR
ncbi:MAG: DctA-YdbH domain-containing protein [Nitrospira sp.]|nr:MAG: DctA-YdbH domain-containing protein [Nitrospira sp.]